MLPSYLITVGEAGATSASVTSAVTSALSLSGTVINFAIDQPILSLCIGASIAIVGFVVFRKARKSVGF